MLSRRTSAILFAAPGINTVREKGTAKEVHSKMIYGILLESCRDGVRELYGAETWKRVVQELSFEHESFTTLGRYDETVIARVAECKERGGRLARHDRLFFFFSGLADILHEGGPDFYMQLFGQCFVKFFTNYGYDKILRVAGRHFRDFLLSIDQLHDSTRFSFPKMKSPLFHVTEEDENGAMLHYKYGEALGRDERH